MADNLEIRVEQLTDAIRGLYNKPSLTPAELNNAFNTMLQRFENQTNLSSEKLLQIITNEIKRTAEERHGAIKDILYNFEDVIKNAAAQMTNPKFEMEVSKISTDLNSIASRLSNQDLQIQKFSQSIEALRTAGTAAEMAKLSNDFATFSRGFDSITSTLNSNFAEFLAQVQGYSQKDEIIQLRHQLEEIIKNSQTIIVAGDRIDSLQSRLHNVASKEDTNYINEKITILTSFLSDLKAYMEKNDIDSREQLRTVFGDIEQKLSSLDPNSLNEIKGDIKNLFEEIRNTSTYSKDEILSRFQNIVDVINKSYNDLGEKLSNETNNMNSSLAQLTGEIQKVCSSVTDGITGRTEEIKMQLQTLGQEYQSLKESVCSNSNIETAVNAILKSNSETIDLSHDFIQTQIQKVEERIAQQEEVEKQHLVNAVELLKSEFSQVSDRICSLEADLGGENLSRAFDETLERINGCVETLRSTDALRDLSSLMANVTNDINNSIQMLKENFERAQDGSSLQVLQQLNEAVPIIADRLEVFRNHVVSENSANITELKQHFSEVIDTITNRVEQITSSIRTDFENYSSGSLDNLKVDLQNMSNHIMESVEAINDGISKEFNDHKTNIDELLSKISDYEDKFRDKLNSIESTFETLSQESTDRVNDTLSLNQLQFQETLAAMKEDILSGIMGINKNNKTNFEIVDAKLESIAEKSARPIDSAVSSLQNTNQHELLVEIESKIERCNLQQIHNGKELLGEIQNLNTELSFKLENMSQGANSEIPPSLIRGIDDKVQSLLENSVDKEATVNLIKAHVDLRMKEVVQRLIKVVNVFRPDPEKEADAQKAAASVRLDELLSQLEYLKNNIFDEIREGFNKREELIEEISKNAGETLSNTVYLKNNLVNEFKEAIEERLEGLKNIEFLIEDVKNSTQSVQQTVLERINSLNEDLNNNIKEDLNSLRSIEENINTKIENVRDEIVSKIEENSNSSREQVIQNSDQINENVSKAVDTIKEQISQTSDFVHQDILQNVNNSKEHIIQTLSQAISETVGQIVEQNVGSLEKNLNGTQEENYQKIETILNQASERIASTVLDNLKGHFSNLENILGTMPAFSENNSPAHDSLTSAVTDSIKEKLDDVLNAVSKTAETAEENYSLADVESDLTKLRFSIEKSNKNIGADFKNLGGWLKNTTTRLDNLARLVDSIGKKVNNTEKINLEEIKSRLIESEKAYHRAYENQPQVQIPDFDESLKQYEEFLRDFAGVVQKKYKTQEMRIEELSEKISALVQKQNEGFDVKQLIDIFYDNTTNTKSLVSRIDAMEAKMNSISKNIERIVSYIDE